MIQLNQKNQTLFERIGLTKLYKSIIKIFDPSKFDLPVSFTMIYYSKDEINKLLMSYPANSGYVGFDIKFVVTDLQSNRGTLKFFPVLHELIETNIDSNTKISSNVTTTSNTIEMDHYGFNYFLNYHKNVNINSNFYLENAIILLEDPTPNVKFPINKFEFFDEKKEFDKAFISWFELKMIANHCEFIGITGAQVSSGQITAKPWRTSNGAIIASTGNVNYFTFRFLVINNLSDYAQQYKHLLSISQNNNLKLFTKSNVKIDNPNEALFKALTKNNTKKYKIMNSQIQKLPVNTSVATETWAAPCPPMWHSES